MSTYVHINTPSQSFDYEQLTVGVAANALTVAKYTVLAASGNGDQNYTRHADEIMLQIEDNPVRIRFDGVDPTALVGHLYVPGDVIFVQGFANIQKVKMIRQGGADAKVSVTYFRRS